MAKKHKREEAELDPEVDPSTQKKRKKKKKAKKDKWGQTVVGKEEDEAEKALENGSNDAGEVKEAQQGDDTDDKKCDQNTVVVSGMPYTTEEEEIKEMFKDCGSISRMDLTTFADTGNFKGLAFVRFETQDGAKSALALDGMKMGRRFLKIEPCRNRQKKDKKLFEDPPAKANGCLSAYVGNLPRDVREDDIRKLFNDSKIKSIKLALYRNSQNTINTQKCRGFGHVFFDDDESLENAMKKNQQELGGRPIKIAYSVNY